MADEKMGRAVVRISPELREKLDAEGARLGIGFTTLIRILVLEALENREGRRNGR